MNLKNLVNSCARSFLNLAFAPVCCCCFSPVDDDRTRFCLKCSDDLCLIDPQERCHLCFTPKEEERICQGCLTSDHLFSGVASAFDYQSCASSLVRQLKYSGATRFAKDLAAFSVVQLSRLNWPLPDVIVPVACTRIRTFFRGFNQSALIAKEVSLMLERPCLNHLKRQRHSLSQAGLNISQRRSLDPTTFSLKDGVDIEDKTILLIDDVITTRRTLDCAALALSRGYPKAIYAFGVLQSFC